MAAGKGGATSSGTDMDTGGVAETPGHAQRSMDTLIEGGIKSGAETAQQMNEDTSGISSRKIGGGAEGGKQVVSGLMRLKNLGLHDLPWHEDFASSSDKAKHPPIDVFIKQVFDEAKSWARDIPLWKKTGTHKFGKKSIASGIEVEQFVKDDGAEGTWFARLSKHKEKEGSEWHVWDRVLRFEHSVHEAEYTPNVFGCNTVLKFVPTVRKETQEDFGMKDLSLDIINMYHGIPAPLNDRVFTILVLAGVRTDLPSDGSIKNEFIVVQLPVDLSSFPDHIKDGCDHTISANPTYQPKGKSPIAEKTKVGKKLVQGQYASIEKVSNIGGENHWVMATASDAKGVLPQWVQKRAIPGEIAKDVEYVYDYMDWGIKT